MFAGLLAFLYNLFMTLRSPRVTPSRVSPQPTMALEEI
jgi:hypothetical protein